MNRERTIEVELSNGRKVRVPGYTRLCKERFESFTFGETALVGDCAKDVTSGEEILDSDTLSRIDTECFDPMVQAELD